MQSYINWIANECGNKSLRIIVNNFDHEVPLIAFRVRF